ALLYQREKGFLCRLVVFDSCGSFLSSAGPLSAHLHEAFPLGVQPNSPKARGQNEAATSEYLPHTRMRKSSQGKAKQRKRRPVRLQRRPGSTMLPAHRLGQSPTIHRPGGIHERVEGMAPSKTKPTT